ncbi:MAG: IS1 family transposase [Kluyvera sp.]|uniref:IS1 family transposase n=1 Tax=Kluyvera sp. TaxID=1538228 RepID=UPI003F3444E2
MLLRSFIYMPDALPKGKRLNSNIFTQRIGCNNLMPRPRIKRLARRFGGFYYLMGNYHQIIFEHCQKEK